MPAFFTFGSSLWSEIFLWPDLEGSQLFVGSAGLCETGASSNLTLLGVMSLCFLVRAMLLGISRIWHLFRLRDDPLGVVTT